ncbi:hypothetical protein [Fibrivirga algicola]|uniref:Lipoprotein n=1 Tax=Fibrivirga algicola TaxID=2950420 RepID=A0ABX0QE97_9BACT|nr:hypothetical protein [Fibrivirga algicola]NID09540.1 hypothetical protein [Fibrivirga algicola]
MKTKIFGLLFFAFLQSCILKSDCENELISALNSDDDKLSLFLFTRDCGATTATSVQLLLRSKEDNLTDNETGNIFVADGKPTLESYREAVSVKWISKNVVEVQFDKTLRVFEQDTTWGSTKIKYLLK